MTHIVDRKLVFFIRGAVKHGRSSYNALVLFYSHMAKALVHYELWLYCSNQILPQAKASAKPFKFLILCNLRHVELKNRNAGVSLLFSHEYPLSVTLFLCRGHQVSKHQ